ncbi:hypothetical protein ABPG75_007003 [Micractinium tetrahymenae]
MALRPPHEESGAPPAAAVSVEFRHLPPESRLKLDEALQAWASWHTDRYPEGYVPPEVVSGSLGYTPGTMLLGSGAADVAGADGDAAANGGGAFVWEDKPEAPAKGGADTLWFNISYERVGDVPRYDRGSDAPLRHSARKRPASDGLLAAEGAQGAGRPAKRSRSANRCFNCGSYGHSLRECFKEHNREQVEESRRELAEQREASGAAQRGAARRYYEPHAPASGQKGVRGLEQEEGEFAGLEPGRLTDELRAALGIGPLAPPPWLQRMRELGLPPGYMAPVSAAAEEALGRPGSGDAGARPGDSPAAAAPAATNGAAGAAGTGAEGFGDLEDFIALSDSPPPPPPAAGAAAEAAGAAGAAGEGAAGVAAEEQQECAVHFPGVNAPLPEGADPQAWALQRPASLSTTPLSAQRAQQQQQALPGSDGHSVRRSSSGAWAGIAPLRGLHPPWQQVAAEGAPAAAARPAHHTPPMQHAASAPDLRWGQPSGMLPPGFGQQAQHGYHPQQAQHQQQAQQLQQQAAQPAYQQQQQVQQVQHTPLQDVYATSRSDPGHLLVYHRGQATAGQLPGLHAPAFRQHAAYTLPGQAWGAAAQALQPWQQQQYGQPSFANQQQHPGYSPASDEPPPQQQQLWGRQQQGQERQQWEQGGHTQQRWEQSDPEQRRREQQEAERRQREYQQRLWQSDGR